MAITLHRRALTDQQRRIGLDHADALATWFCVAQVMAARGDHAGAGSEFRGMLPYLRRRLGPGHPHTCEAAEWAGR